MKTLLRYAASAAVLACLSTCAMAATPFSKTALSEIMQGDKPPASPDANAEVTLKSKRLHVKYNSPQMRGRVIMGGLVPYGKVWRTGANSATTFTTEIDLKIGDLVVPAGSYTLFTMPAAPGTPWQLIVNKQNGQWGLEYHQEQDLGRVPMKFSKLSAPQEGMSISFEHTTGNSTELHVKWETTDESVKITAK